MYLELQEPNKQLANAYFYGELFYKTIRGISNLDVKRELIQASREQYALFMAEHKKYREGNRQAGIDAQFMLGCMMIFIYCLNEMLSYSQLRNEYYQRYQKYRADFFQRQNK